jgi:hypothetical protein
MADDARAAALVASTIALAHSLDLRIVAEGVETGVVFTELRRLGCDQAQGYFMSGPVSVVELDYWLSNRPELDQSTDITSPLAPVPLSMLRTPGLVNRAGELHGAVRPKVAPCDA